MVLHVPVSGMNRHCMGHENGAGPPLASWRSAPDAGPIGRQRIDRPCHPYCSQGANWKAMSSVRGATMATGEIRREELTDAFRAGRRVGFGISALVLSLVGFLSLRRRKGDPRHCPRHPGDPRKRPWSIGSAARRNRNLPWRCFPSDDGCGPHRVPGPGARVCSDASQTLVVGVEECDDSAPAPFRRRFPALH